MQRRGTTAQARRMRHLSRQAVLRIAVLGLVTVISAATLIPAKGQAAAGPRRAVTDRALGLSITLPAGWQRLSRANDAPPGITLAWAGHPPSVRLTVEALGPMRTGTPGAIARAFSCGLTRGMAGVSVSRRPVQFGGAPGVLMHGMPGTHATTQIVLVKNGVVYLLVAPGHSLATDQRQALAGLRFTAPVNGSRVLTMRVTVKKCGG